MIASRSGRFLLYGLAGWCAEVAYTGVENLVKRRDPRLPAQTSRWMFPIYGLTQPLFEPLHDAMRDRVRAPLRAGVYSAAFLAVEYATGRGLRAAAGEAPWDYSHARFHLHGLIRAEYVPLWAGIGLAAERPHDALAGRGEGHGDGGKRSLPDT